MRSFSYLAGLSFFLFAACGGASQGGLTQDCYPNGTCNVGLVCTAGSCAAGSGDGGTPDSGTPDTGAPDLGTPDTGTPDMGAASCDPYTELDETATSSCGADMRCALDFTDGSHHCASMGVVAIGGNCSLAGAGVDDCMIGSECVAPGICAQRCVEGTSSCYTGTSCFGDPTTHDGACYPDCDIFAARDCGRGQNCDALPDGSGKFIATCVDAGGERAIGEPCTDSSLCTGGVCGVLLPGAPSVNCLAVCDASHTCTSGTCTPFPDTTVPGLGYCL